MNEVLFLSFLAATLLLLIAPGPSCALATSQAIRYGPRAALLTVAGDAIGTLVHIVVATLGLQLLIGLASSVLPWLQIAGGAYILYLAHRSFRDGRQPDFVELRNSQSDFEALFSGFIACVSNPKAIVFFAALFPGFIDTHYNVFFQSAVYGTIFIILDAVSILAYATFGVLVLKSRWLSAVHHTTFSAVGLGLIGTFLLGKGCFEVVDLFR